MDWGSLGDSGNSDGAVDGEWTGRRTVVAAWHSISADGRALARLHPYGHLTWPTRLLVTAAWCWSDSVAGSDLTLPSCVSLTLSL